MPVQTWAIGVDGASQVAANLERFSLVFSVMRLHFSPHEILPLGGVNVPSFVYAKVVCIGLADVPA